MRCVHSATAAALLCMCAAAPLTMHAAVAPVTYILLAADGLSLPSDLDARVAAAGGLVTQRLPEIGVAIASSSNPSFPSMAASIAGLRAVARDVTLALDLPIAVAAIGNPPFSGDDDALFDMQWGLDAIDAPEAWALGFRGAGVRVAVLDTGIDLDHPDLAPNLNLALSTSFVPGVPVDAPLGPPSFTAPAHHGTWVAGIIAAADNGIGTIGVAPEAEIVAVRVGYEDGRVLGSALLTGLVYAANIKSDVINMSLTYYLPRGGFIDAEGNYLSAHDVAELYVAWTRALQFAVQSGATIIEAVGNSALDLDGNGDVHTLAQAPGIIGVAATSPRGWAVNPTTDLDLPAPYTNYGQSAIDVAAPGGYLDLAAFLNPPWAFCTIAVTLPCFAFDMVVGPTVGGWSLNFGTSGATPHVAGVAALVIGAHGGRMHPEAVAAALRGSADDLGKPGIDDFYGHGRVNAAKAVQVR